MSCCGSLRTVRASRAEFLDCQHTRIPACDLTCHIIRALQPAPAIVGTRSADVEGAHAQRERSLLLAHGEHLALAELARSGLSGLGGAGAAALGSVAGSVRSVLAPGVGCCAY